MNEVQRSHFNVGLLQQYGTMAPEDIIPTLQASRSFSPIKRVDFFNTLAANISVFEERVDKALEGSMEWTEVCDEPKYALCLDRQWHVDTKKRAEQKSDQEKFTGVENKLMEALYYTLYVIALWRAKFGVYRFHGGIESFDAFRTRYKSDRMFVNQKAYELVSMTNDEWLTFFQYRNIVILASAVSPKKASQKCIFMKIIGCLVEDKIHATGSKQSHAAARIAHIYDREGGTFNQRKSEQFNGASIKITRKRPKADAEAYFIGNEYGHASHSAGVGGSKMRRVAPNLDVVDHTDALADILLSLSGGSSSRAESTSDPTVANTLPQSALVTPLDVTAVAAVDGGSGSVAVSVSVSDHSPGRSRCTSRSSDSEFAVAAELAVPGSKDEDTRARFATVVSVQGATEEAEESTEFDCATKANVLDVGNVSGSVAVVSPNTPAQLAVSPPLIVGSGVGATNSSSVDTSASASSAASECDSETKCHFGDLVDDDQPPLVST